MVDGSDGHLDLSFLVGLFKPFDLPAEHVMGLPPVDSRPAHTARLVAAKRLGVRVQTLDAEVSRRRPQSPENDRGGSSVLFAEIEPWPDHVDGAALLDDLAAVFSRFLALPAHAAETMALWTVHAHAHDGAQISPILALFSPEKRCGKTTALGVLQRLVRRPLPASNITVAALFRSIDKWGPTLLVDEADTFLKDSDELRGILNSGHSRGQAVVIRTVGDDHEPRAFNTWAPKAIALIGALPSTLEDRAIGIPMCRRRSDEPVERLRADRDPGIGGGDVLQWLEHEGGRRGAGEGKPT